MPTQAVFGVLKTRSQAAALIRDVSRAGFNLSQISVLVPDLPEATGGQARGELGLLSGLVAVSIPGLRTAHGAGPLVSTLAGWSTAGVTHGLIALRLSEPLARQYERKVAEGDILASIQTREPRDVDRLKAILWQNQAELVASSEPPPGVSGRPSRPPAVIPL